MSSEPINRELYDYTLKVQRHSHDLRRRGDIELEATISYYEQERQDSLGMLKHATPGMDHYDYEVCRHDMALAVVAAAREQLIERAQLLAEAAIKHTDRAPAAKAKPARSHDERPRPRHR